MGLSDSLRNRLTLSKGESLRETVRIFLANKKERRRIAGRKFPSGSIPAVAAPFLDSPPRRDDAHRKIVDPAWYAEVQLLADGADSWDHFLSLGLPAGLAPMPSLAGLDGRHLSPRGAEFLHRLGLPLGAVADKPVDPADASLLDPWSIGNPSSKPLAVVTAITAAHERLLPIAHEWTAQADFFAVTDFGFAAPEPWRLVRPVFHAIEPQRRLAFARTHLPAFFHAYFRVLWLDPGVLSCANPGDILPAAGPALSCYKLVDTSLMAEAAAVARSGQDATEAVAALVGKAAHHPAFSQAGLLDPRVLLFDPKSEPVRRMMARWWCHVMSGSHAGRLSLSLALADTPDLDQVDLAGTMLSRSSRFALRGSE